MHRVTIRHKLCSHYPNSCRNQSRRIFALWSEFHHSFVSPSGLLCLQVIFFGANDACLPGSSTNQHVPLERFKQNVVSIVKHPSVVAQKPRLILVTPPPVNEFALEESDLLKGLTDPRRTAEHTKKYADATRKVGGELGIVVLDIWSIFMAMTGWKEGDPLIGSKKVARSEVLEKLLADGKFHDEDIHIISPLLNSERIAFSPSGLQGHVYVCNGSDSPEMAGSVPRECTFRLSHMD